MDINKYSLEDYPVYRSKIAHNKTSLYLNPTLGINQSSKLLKEVGYINTYLGWEECEESHKDCLFLLFNPRPKVLKESWSTFEDIYRGVKTFVCSYDVDLGMIILVFRIMTEYKGLPKLLLQGKYSLFPNDYTRRNFRVRENSTTEYREMLQYKVIMKSPDRKNYLEEITGSVIDETMEYDSIPDRDDEYFNLKRFKEQYGKE